MKKTHQHPSVSIYVFRGILGTFTFLFLLLLTLYIPPKVPTYGAIAQYTQYPDAVKTISTDIVNEPDDVNPICKPILLTHGEKTEHVVVFFHGFTSCPGQFLPLGKRLYELGYNVYIPRAPFHGLKDKRTHALDNLTAEIYVRYAERSISIAGGLGNNVTVVGISGGAILSNWIAVHDNTIYKAIIIAPSYGFKEIPQCIVNPFIHIMSIYPSQYRWYDEVKKGKSDDPGNGYHGFTTHSLVEILKLGQEVGRSMLAGNIAAKHVLLISNAHDMVIDKKYIRDVQNRYMHDPLYANRVSFFEYGDEFQMGHDIIDTNVTTEQREMVASNLVKQIRE